MGSTKPRFRPPIFSFFAMGAGCSWRITHRRCLPPAHPRYSDPGRPLDAQLTKLETLAFTRTVPFERRCGILSALYFRRSLRNAGKTPKRDVRTSFGVSSFVSRAAEAPGTGRNNVYTGDRTEHG